MTKKQKMAEKYLNCLGFKDMWINDIKRLMKNHSAGVVDEMVEIINEDFDFEGLKNKQIELLVENLTLEELTKIYDFQLSIGMKMKERLSNYNKEVSDYISNCIEEIFKKKMEEDKF